MSTIIVADTGGKHICVDILLFGASQLITKNNLKTVDKNQTALDFISLIPRLRDKVSSPSGT